MKDRYFDNYLDLMKIIKNFKLRVARNTWETDFYFKVNEKISVNNNYISILESNFKKYNLKIFDNDFENDMKKFYLSVLSFEDNLIFNQVWDSLNYNYIINNNKGIKYDFLKKKAVEIKHIINIFII